MASRDEHTIICSICRRALIVKHTLNNGVAFLSHLKLDHGKTVKTIESAKFFLKALSMSSYKLR